MYECWAWIDGECLRGWDVGDTDGGIKFRPRDCMKDTYEISPLDHLVYSKTKPSMNPEEVNNVE